VRDNTRAVPQPKKGYRLIKGDVPEGDYTVPIGQAKVTRPGSDISVYAYGMMHYYCQQAAEEVAQDGIDVELIDLRTLNPLDKDTVLNSFKKTGKALIVYEDNRFLGMARGSPQSGRRGFNDMDRRLCAWPGLMYRVPYSHPQSGSCRIRRFAEAMRLTILGLSLITRQVTSEQSRTSCERSHHAPTRGKCSRRKISRWRSGSAIR
jgi:hypothetical protein